MKSLLKKYIDKMAAFKGATSRSNPEYVVKESSIQERVLHVAIPRNATAEQQEVLDAMIQYAEQEGVVMIVEVVR